MGVGEEPREGPPEREREQKGLMCDPFLVSLRIFRDTLVTFLMEVCHHQGSGRVLISSN